MLSLIKLKDPKEKKNLFRHPKANSNANIELLRRDENHER
jgi:hypothetical protein